MPRNRDANATHGFGHPCRHITYQTTRCQLVTSSVNKYKVEYRKFAKCEVTEEAENEYNFTHIDVLFNVYSPHKFVLCERISVGLKVDAGKL